MSAEELALEEAARILDRNFTEWKRGIEKRLAVLEAVQRPIEKRMHEYDV